MSALPKKVYTAAQSRELDRLAIKEYGIEGYRLMRRAGQAVFDQIGEHFPEAKSMAVLCGPGNNGGDGFVIAKLAHDKGLSTQVYLVCPAEKIKGDAALAFKDMRRAGIEPEPYQAQDLARFDLIVDAIFGTGLQRQAEGKALQAIQAMNHQSAPVLAVDIPSGLHADTGHALGTAVQAHTTVSFIGLKQGLFTGAGRQVCGNIVFNDLQVPDEVYGRVQAAARRLDLKDLQARLLRPRDRNSHKGSFGQVLVIGGQPGMAGAVCLAARSAYRAGAGLVSVATHPSHGSFVNAVYPELIVASIAEAELLQQAIEKASVLVLGPGLGQSDWSKMLFTQGLQSPKPMVLDADALNCLAESGAHLRRSDCILTPHPGEAARLLGVSSAEIQKDRFTACRQIAERYSCVCILKGAGSLIYADESGMRICDYGNPGMATAGMGDCLAGLLGGLLAQGIPAAAAASLGTCIHAVAGDLEAQQGQRGMLASDLLPHIRRLVNGI